MGNMVEVFRIEVVKKKKKKVDNILFFFVHKFST